MTNKHTPGPWFYAWVGENGDHFLHISSPTGEICDLPMFRYGDLPPSMVNATREANARLIASAPELLEALKEIRQAEKRIREYYQAIEAGTYLPDENKIANIIVDQVLASEKADKAIAKAEGLE